MMAQIAIDAQKIATFCHKYQIKRLALFGSALRADFRPDSDVDVLVEFSADAKHGLFASPVWKMNCSVYLAARWIWSIGQRLSKAGIISAVRKFLALRRRSMQRLVSSSGSRDEGYLLDMLIAARDAQLFISG
jgi:uncharacterized protein